MQGKATLLLLLIAVLVISFRDKKQEKKLVFKTVSGDSITVVDDIIYYNDNLISSNIDDIVYKSKYNRLIEKDSTLLLFLEINGKPNYNKLQAYEITPDNSILLTECVYNDSLQGIGPPPFTDMDGDGKLEIGGFDITERYPSEDSMYYNPSKYYEISKGTVLFDTALTKQMDIKINGLYMENPNDDDDNCCVVIKKPKKMSKYGPQN